MAHLVLRGTLEWLMDSLVGAKSSGSQCITGLFQLVDQEAHRTACLDISPVPGCRIPWVSAWPLGLSGATRDAL